MNEKTSRRTFAKTLGCVVVSSLAVPVTFTEGEAGKHVLNPLRYRDVDLRTFMTYGVEHIYHGAIDRRYNCLPFVRFNLTDPPTWAKHIDWGCPHMVGRFVDALAVTATVCTFEPDDEANAAFRGYLHDCLDNEFTMPFHITLNGPAQNGWIHNCREVLLGLLGLASWKGDSESADLAGKFVRSIEKVTRATGHFPSGSIGTAGFGSFDPTQLNMCSGRLIRALLNYYRLTGDELGVELGRRFADVNIRETFTPDGGLKEASGNHLHSTQGTMTGLIDLGFLTGEQRYSTLGCRLYENGLRPWRTSYGWAKEYKTYDDPNHWHYDSGEANNTGDYIESALLLGLNGAPEYFREAECFIRNGLLAAQVLNTGWIEQSDEPDTEEIVYTEMRRRARGAFVFTTPNGYQHYHTDLMGGALQSMSEAYHAIVSHHDGTCHVNMLFPADTEWLAIRSDIPRSGRVTLEAVLPCEVLVRIPGWIDRKTISLRANGTPHTPAWHGGELSLGALVPGAKVEITFNQPKRHSEEDAPGYEAPFAIDWIGDTIVAMNPGREGSIPLY